MNGLPAQKLWQAPDFGSILRNIAVIKGQKLRSRLAEAGELRAQSEELRRVEELDLRKAAGGRAEKAGKRAERALTLQKEAAGRAITKEELERSLKNSSLLLSTAQNTLATAQGSPQEAQKAHDIAIQTLQEVGADTSEIPEEWGPEAIKYWQDTAQRTRPLVAWLISQKEKKDTRTGRQKEFDRYKKAHPEFKGDIIEFEKLMKEAGRAAEKPVSQIAQYNLAKKEGYEGNFTEWKKEVAKAGAPTMTQIIGAEKFGIRKAQTAGTLRTDLVNNKDNKDFFKANADLYNKINEKNEVAYWDSPPEGLSKFDAWKYNEKIIIIKLTDKNIKDGWTPEKVQKFAKDNSMTPEEVLERIGTIE